MSYPPFQHSLPRVIAFWLSFGMVTGLTLAWAYFLWF